MSGHLYKGFLIEFHSQLAMGQNPNRPPVNIQFNPTSKIGSKMGGEFTYQPKRDPIEFDNHSQLLLYPVSPPLRANLRELAGRAELHFRRSVFALAPCGAREIK